MRSGHRRDYGVATALIIALVVLGMITACEGQQESTGNTPEVQGEVVPLTKHWEKAIPNQEPPEGLESLSAEYCGKCHDDIYAEWKTSNHAVAFQDPQFQAEWAKDDSLWVCINCHTPLQNQQPLIVKGKMDGDYFQPVTEPNPQFDAALREESITCAVCHVRDGAVIGTVGAGSNAPHKVVKDPEFLSEQLCMSCHNVTDVLNPRLVCTFGTGDEWLAGPYPEAGRNCITCHMPLVERPLAANNPIRKARKHTFIGSGIPKFPDPDRELVEGYIRGLDIRVYSAREAYYPGQTAYYTVTLINQRAGHMLPTGDPEYFYVVLMQIKDGAGKVLKERRERIGQQWEWWPEAKKLGDNRLKPLEERSFSIDFEVPWRVPGLVFEVSVTMVRVTEENARFMGLLGKYPLSATIFHEIREVLAEE